MIGRPQPSKRLQIFLLPAALIFSGFLLASTVTVHAAPTLTTSLQAGDPAVPGGTFDVLVTLSESSTDHSLAAFLLNVNFDSRKVDLVGAAYEAGGFGGSEAPALTPPASEPPANPGAGASRRVSAADLAGTSTASNGAVVVLTFQAKNWTAAPINIEISAPGIIRPGGAEEDALLGQDNLGATPTFEVFPITPVAFNNSATMNLGAPDADGDGKPDACEVVVPSASQTNIYLRDSDGEGLLDGEEDPLGCTNFPPTYLATSPRKYDSDGDGFPDALEVLVMGTDPLDSNDPDRTDPKYFDADGDGLPAYLDPNEASIDSDGDGYADGYEATNGFDPNNSASKPSLGDVNGSGSITNADIILLRQYVGGRNPANAIKDNMDVNLSGTITNADIIRLRQFFGKQPGREVLP
jgi:hypothetical protein